MSTAEDTSRRPLRLLLASASPRRRRLLACLGVPYDTTSVDTPEELTPGEAPTVLATRIAAEKALAARETLSAEEAAVHLVLACDTIVVLDDAVLGKPRDLDDAYRMLRALSGRTHEVVTGCALLGPADETPETFAVATEVRMRELSDADMDAWAAKGELLGCAGAYNIESQIASVEGGECFQNVAGLPICDIYGRLQARGDVEGLERPVAACDALLDACCARGRELLGE